MDRRIGLDISRTNYSQANTTIVFERILTLFFNFYASTDGGLCLQINRGVRTLAKIPFKFSGRKLYFRVSYYFVKKWVKAGTSL